MEGDEDVEGIKNFLIKISPWKRVLIIHVLIFLFPPERSPLLTSTWHPSPLYKNSINHKSITVWFFSLSLFTITKSKTSNGWCEDDSSTNCVAFRRRHSTRLGTNHQWGLFEETGKRNADRGTPGEDGRREVRHSHFSAFPLCFRWQSLKAHISKVGGAIKTLSTRKVLPLKFSTFC